MKLEEYKSFLDSNSSFSCRFNINRLGTLMYLDGSIKVMLDEKLDSRVAEKYIDRDIEVEVKTIDEVSNTVYVNKAKSLEERIIESISSGKEYKCKAIVKDIKRRVLIADIVDTDLKGVLLAENWRNNAFIRDLREKCDVGDVIDVCVYAKNDIDEYDIDVKLTRESITTDPWEMLMDDIWVEDVTLDVTCVEMPKGKTYWWGVCDQIEDIDLMGDYSFKFEVKKNGKYRCKIDECNKEKHIFKIVPFAEIIEEKETKFELENDTRNDDQAYDINEEKEDVPKPTTEQTEKELEYDEAVVQAIAAEIVDRRAGIIERPGLIRDLVINHIKTETVPVSLVGDLLSLLLKNGSVDMAYRVYKVFRGNVFVDENLLIAFLNHATGIAKKQTGIDPSLIDSLYTEYYIYLKSKQLYPEKSTYVGLYNSAVNYYMSSRRYYNLIQFLEIRANATPKDDDKYDQYYAELYTYKGFYEKSIGDYSAAISQFQLCIPFAKRITDKALKDKYRHIAYAEMKKCQGVLDQFPVDKYFINLDYEGAYKYFLNIHTKNPELDSVTELFNKISRIYDRSQTRVETLPSETKKGYNFRRATAAEVIEENLPKAEKLWKRSIEKKEPGRLAAIKSYVSVLIREKKYVEALDECKRYLKAFLDPLDEFAIRIKIVEVYQLLGANEDAIKFALSIVNKNKAKKDFVDQGGLRRLAPLLYRVASIQSNELGLYHKANLSLNNALGFGLERNAYASGYINNCLIMGDYDAVKDTLNKYREDLADEYVYSVQRSLKDQTGEQQDGELSYIDTYSSRGNETFYKWYVSKCVATCPEDIKEYFESEEIRTIDDVISYVNGYPGYDNNLNAQVYLNSLAAQHIFENIDGYASKAYYGFLANSLVADIKIRDSRRRESFYLSKYATIALCDSEGVDSAIVILKNALEHIHSVKEAGKKKIYTAILLGSNPLLKLNSDQIGTECCDLINKIAEKSSIEESITKVGEWINSYNDQNKRILDQKTDLINSFDIDQAKAEQILAGFLDKDYVVLEDDERHVERLIDINRGLIKEKQISDYVGKNNGLDKARERIQETRHMMEDGITPLSLMLWIEVLDRLAKLVEDEQANINVTLAPRISVSIDNGTVFSTNGKIHLNYSLSNETNCAPARNVLVEFEDGEGNQIAQNKSTEGFILSGGESKSFIQRFNKDSSFSLNIRVSYDDVDGLDKEIVCSESIIVNQAKEFSNIPNPFTTAAGFDPNDAKRVFVGRENLINTLKQQLLDASINCAVLYGQKRTGKTSIFKRLSKVLSDDFVACRVSMNSISDMDMFYKAVAYSFKKETADRSIKEQLNDLGTPCDRFEFEEYIQSVTDIFGRKVLLLLDEFSHLYDLRTTDFPERFMNEWKELMEYNLFSAIITGQETLADLINIYANQFAVQYTVPVDYISYEYFHDLVDVPIYTVDGQSRYKEKSFEKLWSLTKGHPYLTQSFCDSMIKYLNSNKTEYIFDATIDKVMENYIQNANEKDFDSFYCRYSKNDGEYAEEVNATLSFLIKLAEECGYSGNGVCDVSRMGLSAEEEAIKTSLARRGVIDIDANNRCEIRVKLFYEWLRRKGKNIFSLQNVYEFGKAEQKIAEERVYEAPQVINNYISGDVNQITASNYVENQTNNIEISIENAVMGLEKLQSMVIDGVGGVSEIEVKKEFEQLPFNSDTWIELSDDEREEKTYEYADQMFRSQAFINKELTEEQKNRFCLSDETMNMLSQDCRKQIICGVQVYDLIQYCIDNFGLEMNVSESPRAILFARAFEKHMKDCMYQLLGTLDGFKHQTLPNKRTLSDTDINKTTIGNYAFILKHGDICKLSGLAADRLGRSDLDEQWWKDLTKKLSKIGDLRNECCHSGSKFAYAQLTELIKLIFEDESIESVHVLKEIEDRSNHRTVTNSSSGDVTKKPETAGGLDEDLIGKTVVLVMEEKTVRKSVRGKIMNQYTASLSPLETKKVGFEKGKKVKVIVKAIQEDRYVVAIPD